MYGDPPVYGTRKNPQTGKIETYEITAKPVDLEKARKEFRDFISGNVQWHDAPYSAREPNPDLAREVDLILEDDQYVDFLDNYAVLAEN